MQDIQLIIEAGDDGFWGRVTHNDDLIADQAETVEALQQNMKKLLLNFHKVPDVTFTLAYDLLAFFERYSYLKVSNIAQEAGMNPTLLRHYAAGSKKPSAEQVKRIEEAVHRLAIELANVHLVAA